MASSLVYKVYRCQARCGCMTELRYAYICMLVPLRGALENVDLSPKSVCARRQLNGATPSCTSNMSCVRMKGYSHFHPYPVSNSVASHYQHWVIRRVLSQSGSHRACSATTNCRRQRVIQAAAITWLPADLWLMQSVGRKSPPRIVRVWWPPEMRPSIRMCWSRMRKGLTSVGLVRASTSPTGRRTFDYLRPTRGS